MAKALGMGSASLTLEQQQRVNQICDRFEQAWQAGQRPCLDDYLTDLPHPARSVLFQELLMLELTYRRRLGDRPLPEEYRRRFPSQGEQIEAAFREASDPSMPPTVNPSSPFGNALPSTDLDVPAIPGYEILERLGKGAMGWVFKARHCHLNRLAALKVINPDVLHHPQTIPRFHQEARAAAQLSHPNIVTIYDAGEAAGTHYLAMEYVEGTDLSRLLKQNGPLPVAQACDFIRQVAHGLQHAVEHGLVHRDIKPSNLFVTADGQRVKILDFGLARLRPAPEDQPHRELTGPGMLLGTPDYLAPEQAIDSRLADCRADIYSI